MIEDERARQTTFEQLRRQYVENELQPPEGATEAEVRKMKGGSLHRELLAEISFAAKVYALASGMRLDDFEFDLLPNSCGVVVGLRNAFHDWAKSNEPAPLNYWVREKDPIGLIKAHRAPYIDRESVASAASDYLRLPFRSPRVHRFLVEVLVAAELYAFGTEMLTPLAWWVPFKPPLQRRHVLLDYLVGAFWNTVVFLGLAFASAQYLPSLAGDTIAHWATVTFICIYLFLLVMATAAMPFAWYAQRQAKLKMNALISAILTTYLELDSTGVVSPLRVRQVAEKAGDEGAVWPGPLFALLDDSIKRGGLL